MTAILNTTVRQPPASPWICEARALLSLAGPLAATQLAQMAVMTTDVILLGRFSQRALAAAAIGNTIYFFGLADGRRSGLGGLADDRAQHWRAPARVGAGCAPRYAWAFGRSLLTSAPMMALYCSPPDLCCCALGQEPALAARRGPLRQPCCRSACRSRLGYMVLAQLRQRPGQAARGPVGDGWRRSASTRLPAGR